VTPDLQFLDRQAVINRIASQIPRHVLAHYPTPLMRANRLSETLGCTDLWFKRDDLISFGLGGNKIRGLEVILADALSQNADWLMPGFAVQRFIGGIRLLL